MDRKSWISLAGAWLLSAAVGCGDDGRSGEPWVAPSGTSQGSGSGSDGTDAAATDDGSMTGAATSGPEVTTGPGQTSDAGTTAAADSSGSDGGPPSSICDDVVGASLMPPTTCDGPAGNTSTEIPANGLFSTSWFGCYEQDDGTIYMDPFDNCEFACGNQGLCPTGQDGPTCEAGLRWFAADADRYGCGGRIRVTNCDNGNSVVLVTLDRGPNCNSVEMPCEAPVLDMSHDAMVYLFDGGTYGGCELQTVVVEPVDESTPLGPV